MFLRIICIFFLVSQTFGSLVTPPPPDGGKPVIANGRVYYLHHIPDHCKEPRVSTYPSGGIILDRRALILQDSPHRIFGNLEIAPQGCLYIQPGCELRFGPGFGIITNGTLIARGSELPNQRITITKDVGEDTGRPSGDWSTDSRLVDGNTTQDGRLELFYQNQWRGICTNYVNFTEIDANVTCRHLGFLKGNFTYHSFTRNLTSYMLYETPNCRGTENSLFDCLGSNQIKLGHHICDGQQVIGFECEGLRPNLALDHWRGLEFYNSTLEEKYTDENVYVNATYSFLEYLDLLYPGLNTFSGQGVDVNYPQAAISASPYVPLMNNVTIKYGAYDGMNLTEIRGEIHIANSTIMHNRGYGIFVQSAVGEVLVNQSAVKHNWGDGIKVQIRNLSISEYIKEYPYQNSFCFSPNIGSQTYPVYEYQDVIGPNLEKPIMSFCSRTFTTVPYKKITVHFMMMQNDALASGSIEIRDGSSSGELLGHYPISNGSYPQSVTTNSPVAHIKLKYNVPRDKICPIFKPCIRFLLRITTSNDTVEDFGLILSDVYNNTGYGVNVEDMRSKVFINTTQVSNNQYGAGVRVYQGAGQVVINNTVIYGNKKCGVNITYAGGFQLINNSRIIENDGYGVITEYLLLNRTRQESELRLEVVRSIFRMNKWIALRVGNYCKGGHILVNESHFELNQDEAIEYLSCNITTTKPTNFSADQNIFDGNLRHGILISPMLNTIGIISNNTFKRHPIGGLRIDNGYDLLVSRWHRQFEVDYNIFENTFTENYGRYAAYLRLTQDSPIQMMYFKFNSLINNMIEDIFQYLNPRNRACAVLVVSSGNIVAKRNWIQNPESVRNIATHLIDPSVTIDARENYWGAPVTITNEFKPIHERIFDQDDRYNLAKIEYYPVLNTERLYDNFLSDMVAVYKWEFDRGNLIGGVLETGTFEVQRNMVYHVDRDIFIHPGATLRINPGAILEFDSATGMVVHGCLKADGVRKEDTIEMRLWQEENVTAVENRTTTIRLVDGIDEYEGRLEIYINGEWGTICNLGWIEQNSILVCQQLGLTYNPHMAMAKQRYTASDSTPIVMSYVTCDELDTNITQCEAIYERQHDCKHEQDIFIRCQPPTWSGVTLPATRRNGQSCETQIRHVSIQKAGLMDHSTITYTPALRIDYNYFQISFIQVLDSLSDGIHVKFNHPYSENRLEYANLVNNGGNALVTRSPKLDVQYSNFSYSGMSGFLYDPFFTEYDALIVRNSIHELNKIDITETPHYLLGDRSMIFLVCKAGTARQDTNFYTEIQTRSTSYRITLQLLDYSPVTSVEKVTVYDGRRNDITPQLKKWEVEEDLIDFPVVSSSNYLTIHVHVRGIRSGRLAFAVISEGYHPSPPELLTKFFNCTFDHNYQGIVTKHYNNPSNIKMEIYHRHKEESLYFKRAIVTNSKADAMYMPSVTKYNDDYIPSIEDLTQPQRVASIHYKIELSKFHDNYRGILAEHNHVDFANNVWNWYITESEILRCQEGGLEIELPRVNDISSSKAHSVKITETTMSKNKNFALSINGYYANVTISNNNFEDNVCRKGFLTITGMEKDLKLVNNRFRSNLGRYVIDMDISSHAEYSRTVLATFQLNEFWNNAYFPGLTPPGSSYSPKTYTLAIRGLQNVVAKRNIFNDPDYGYELVAGITALSLTNKVNVKENWWGATNELRIRERIFDFDDWNNYAIADFFPYLTRADVNSDLAVGDAIELPLDLDRLGGRINRQLILPYKPEPYVVHSDLTIMPDASLIVEPGTELHFKPNVGILVLGQLRAEGLPYSRIKLKPWKPQTNNFNNRKKRAVSLNMKLTGGETPNEGFLELYNSSSKSWNIMCDSQFNEKTAEVVCRELGYETVNVRVRFTHLYDYFIYGKPMYFRKEFWFNRYYCRGDESSLQQCMKRYNYNLLPCIYAANYTFIRCGERNLDQGSEYWGNIRFATPEYQELREEVYEKRERSTLKYVDIEGAGMLHGEKVGSIQTTYVTPIFRHINMTKCLHNGYDIIAPLRELEITHQNITNNLGFGVNVLVLNGESNTGKSSFKPLGVSTIPYHVYGLVEICRMEKQITLSNRMILYYKYSHKNVDCVKIIKSEHSFKSLGVRFLQLNLYEDYFSRNQIEIFDGQQISHEYLLGEIHANSSDEYVSQLFQSSGDIITVHIHASVSHESFGFVMEVLTVPLAGLTNPDKKHMIENTILKTNQDGALQYKNIGEINPAFSVSKCWIENNGVAILNLTSPASIDISLHGTKVFNFDYNFVSRNKGGTYLWLSTNTIATAMKGNVTHNVFAYGTNGEALNITGHYYEKVLLYQNYIYNYTTGDFRDVIHVQDVVVNFTYNAVYKNTGNYILAAFNSDEPQATQLYSRSGFSDNNSTALFESTIKIGSGRPKFKDNYIKNDENDFEMTACPKLDAFDTTPITAEENWWGSDRVAYINGKVWDANDEDNLAEVKVFPSKLSNRSVVEGKCLSGWKLDSNRCYRYMGAALPYHEANQFCKENGGYLADARTYDRQRFLEYLLRLMRNINTPTRRVWVSSDVGLSRCSAFQNDFVVEEQDCTMLLYPFICEKDPYILPPDDSVINALAIGIGAGVGAVVVIVLLVICILMLIKSRQRTKQKFERTASMRSSIRGSVRSKSINTILTTETLSRQHLDYDGYSQSSYGTKRTYSQNGSTVHGSMGSLHSLRPNRRGNTAPSLDATSRKELEASEPSRSYSNKSALDDNVSEGTSIADSSFDEDVNDGRNTAPSKQTPASNGAIYSNHSYNDNRKSFSSFESDKDEPTVHMNTKGPSTPQRKDLPPPPIDPRLLQENKRPSPKPSPRTLIKTTALVQSGPSRAYSRESLNNPRMEPTMTVNQGPSQSFIPPQQPYTQSYGHIPSYQPVMQIPTHQLRPSHHQSERSIDDGNSIYPPSYEESVSEDYSQGSYYPIELSQPDTETIRNPNAYYHPSTMPSRHTPRNGGHSSYNRGNLSRSNENILNLNRSTECIETEI